MRIERYPIGNALRPLAAAVMTQQLLCPRTAVHLVCTDVVLCAERGEGEAAQAEGREGRTQACRAYWL